MLCSLFIWFGLYYFCEVEENFDRMKWVPGDVIVCETDGIKGVNTKHYMLAVSTDFVVHVVVHGSAYLSNVGWVKRHPRQKVQVIRDSCVNTGHSYRRKPEEAVAEALRLVGTEHFYNMFACNCEHWTNKWTRGHGGFSSCSGTYTLIFCDAY